MARDISVADSRKALEAIGKPAGRQLLFLKAHAKATGRAMNIASIARSAGYNGFRGGNIQYGLLGAKIGKALGRSDERIGLLVEFVAPKGRSRDHISSEERILVMRPNFARALKAAGSI